MKGVKEKLMEAQNVLCLSFWHWTCSRWLIQMTQTFKMSTATMLWKTVKGQCWADELCYTYTLISFNWKNVQRRMPRRPFSSACQIRPEAAALDVRLFLQQWMWSASVYMDITNKPKVCLILFWHMAGGWGGGGLWLKPDCACPTRSQKNRL